jgi:hypothetical protein
MKPHEQPAERIRIEIYKQMTPAQKWNEFLKLRKFAWELKRAAVREQHADWSDEEIEAKVRQIFLYATT